MAKHLSDRDVEAIVNMINGWSEEKISWNSICFAAENLIGKVPTRQSLNGYKDIVFAYTAKKKGLTDAPPVEKKAINLDFASQRINNLESKIAQLKEENNYYHEMFVVWQYNAYRLGIKENELNAPLPKIDRNGRMGKSDDTLTGTDQLVKGLTTWLSASIGLDYRQREHHPIRQPGKGCFNLIWQDAMELLYVL